MKIRLLCFAIALNALLLAAAPAGAQNKFALKTNLLHDATASVNLAAEYAFAPKMSIELSGSYNGWVVKDIRLQHMLVQPELKFWFCERFNGAFLDVHALAGTATLGSFYDFSQHYRKFPNLQTFLLKDALVLGFGGGIGYDWILSRHWNVEVELGLGYMFTKGDEYVLSTAADGSHYLPDDAIPVLEGSIFDYLGPTKLALSVVYLF